MSSAPRDQPLASLRRTESRVAVLAWPQSDSRPSLLALWHLLSLDAPTVAVVWTLFIARCAGVALSWMQPAAMFLAVWVIYAADRLLDARLLDTGVIPATAEARSLPRELTPIRKGRKASSHLAPRACSIPNELEERHHFHHRYRGRFSATIVVALLTLVLLLPHIGADVLHLYAPLAILLAAWLLLIHAGPFPRASLLVQDPLDITGADACSAVSINGDGGTAFQLQEEGYDAPSRRLPKELIVGIFFPAAAFIPTVAQAPALRVNLLPGAALFAAACALNCLFLYTWEHAGGELSTAEEQLSARRTVHWTTRWATRHIVALAALLCVAGFVLACAGGTLWLAKPLPASKAIAGSLLRGPGIACGLAAALLLTLHRLRAHVSAVHLRALADVALLTPLLVLPLLGSPTLKIISPLLR